MNVSQAFCGRGTEITINDVLVGEAKLVFFNKKGVALLANFVPGDLGQQKIMNADQTCVPPIVQIIFPSHCPSGANRLYNLPVTNWFVEVGVDREVQFFAVFGEDPTAAGPGIRAFDKNSANDGIEVGIIKRERIFGIINRAFTDGDTYHDSHSYHYTPAPSVDPEAYDAMLERFLSKLRRQFKPAEVEPVGVPLPAGGGFVKVNVPEQEDEFDNDFQD